MIRTFLAAAMLAAPAASAPPGPAIRIWSVPELGDALTAKRGEVVLVRGWIDGCLQGMKLYSTCAIASELPTTASTRSLNLGLARSRAAELRNASGRQVILRVRVIGRCNRPDDPESDICLENSSDLVALRVVSVSNTGSTKP